jgi:hypothetical protein
VLQGGGGGGGAPTPVCLILKIRLFNLEGVETMTVGARHLVCRVLTKYVFKSYKL